MTISSPVAGLRPMRFLVAGRFTERIFRRPGRVNSPTARFLMCRSMSTSSSSNTEPTCLRVNPVLPAISVRMAVLVILVLIGPAFFFFGAAAFFAGAFFFAGARFF